MLTLYLYFQEATASVKSKMQSSRKAKKQRTESETSLCSNHSEDSLSSKNASIKQTYPVCISKKFFNEIPKGMIFSIFLFAMVK